MYMYVCIPDVVDVADEPGEGAGQTESSLDLRDDCRVVSNADAGDDPEHRHGCREGPDRAEGTQAPRPPRPHPAPGPAGVVLGAGGGGGGPVDRQFHLRLLDGGRFGQRPVRAHSAYT